MPAYFGRNKPSKCSMGGRGHSGTSPPKHLAAASSVAADFADPANALGMCEPTLDVPAAVCCDNHAHRYSGRAESLIFSSYLATFHLREWLSDFLGCLCQVENLLGFGRGNGAFF